MARTAEETASILKDLYNESFDYESSEPFRITWPQLRTLAAVPRLDESYLKDISEDLAESDYCLVPFDEFLFVARAVNLSHHRTVPGRILEKFVPDHENIGVDDDDVCDEDEEAE